MDFTCHSLGPFGTRQIPESRWLVPSLGAHARKACLGIPFNIAFGALSTFDDRGSIT